ncbi:MAG: hypothetical protein HQK65_12965 [Desulfamplus sp.]|nr:hypothetical protein [Desulfamplus sp.]
MIWDGIVKKFTRRRVHVSFWTILFTITLGPGWYSSIESLFQSFKKGVGINLGFFSIEMPLSIFTLMVSSLIVGIIFDVILNNYIAKHPLGVEAFRDAGSQELKEFFILLKNKTGIKKIYKNMQGIAINQQYADDVITEAKRSKNIKILSIAGYEYIGKGNKSLLFSTIAQQAETIVDVIILDPLEGQNIIFERIKALRQRDPNYTVDSMIKEINETKNQIYQLKKQKDQDDDGKIGLYYTKNHPIFRLVILDTCLFMSTYPRSYHGHESPTYKILKVAEAKSHPDEQNISLYETFLMLFEHIKKEAKPDNLCNNCHTPTVDTPLI